MSGNRKGRCAKAQSAERDEDLRRRLEEAEQTLEAIHRGEVDGLVVAGPQGEQVYSLAGAEHVYRVIVETMNEDLQAQAEQLQTANDLLQAQQHELEEVNKDLRAQERELVDHAEALHASQERLALAARGTGIGLYERKDGACRNLHLSATAVLNETGTPTCMMASFLDITERQQVEEELKESRARLGWVLETTGVGTWLNELPFGGLNWDDQTRRLFFVPPDVEPTIDLFWSRIHPDDREPTRRAVEKAIRDHTLYDIEHRAVNPDLGEVRWIRSLGQATYAPDGTPTRFDGINYDITARQRAEEALRELNTTLESKVAARTAELERERRRLYDVLEAMPAMVCLLTPDYHVAFANRSFRERFGEANGRHCYEFCYGRTEPCEFCETYQVLQTGRPHRWEVTAADGRTIIDAHDFPFTDVDGSPLILEMDLDITERKRAEAALRELNETLSERAQQLQKLTLELSQAEDRERRRIALLLHEDLQQQIAGARFHLNLLKGPRKPETVQETVARVEDMLKEAIEKSRRLSHDLSPAVLNLNDLREVLQWLARRVQAQQGLTVRVDVASAATLHSEALTMFLFRAVQELLFNVVKHAGVNEATLRVRRRGRCVGLRVADRGRGFDPQELRKTAGFGLLSIRERVELLGGRMKIKSAKGQGSTFSIIVPDGAAEGEGPQTHSLAFGNPEKVRAEEGRGLSPSPLP